MALLLPSAIVLGSERSVSVEILIQHGRRPRLSLRMAGALARVTGPGPGPARRRDRIDAGALGWLKLITLLLAWDAIKFGLAASGALCSTRGRCGRGGGSSTQSGGGKDA